MDVFAQFGLTILLAYGAAVVGWMLYPSVNTIFPNSISRQTTKVFFILLFLGYVSVFGGLSILRHISLHSGGFDLGIFDQNIWNSLHGRLFQASIAAKSPITLGQHFSPILLALVPLYAVWANPITLLVLQTLALGIAGIPLFWYTRQKLGRVFAIVMVGAFYLSPALQSINLWEFHEIALVTPMMAFALFFLMNRSYAGFTICSLLMLLTKEEMGLVVAALGGYVFLVQRRFWGLIWIAVGLAWTTTMLLWVIPFFRDETLGKDYQYIERYLYLGDNVPSIIRTALTQPGLVLAHLIVPVKIEFVLHLLIPLGFIPIIGAELFALALPTFAYLLIGDNPFQNSIRFQYTAPILPTVFFAAVVGLERILKFCSSRISSALRIRSTLIILVTVASAVNYYFQSPGPFGLHFQKTNYTITERTLQAYQFMRLLPADAPVLAEAKFVPHLSHRRVIYEPSLREPPPLRQVEYLLVDTMDPVHWLFPELWQDILASPYFETIAEQDGFLLKRRSLYSAAYPLQIQFDQQITLMGYTPDSDLPARPGETRQLILWHADQTIRERYVMFVHLIDQQSRIWAQDDREPANGWFRTDRWNTGDVTPDRYTLVLPGSGYIVSDMARLYSAMYHLVII